MGLVRGCEMTLGYIAHSIFRFFQLVLALTVCGLYGVDLHHANQQHKYSDGKWVPPPPSPFHHITNTPSPKKVFAEVVASLSAFTALIYLIPFTSRIPLLFIWDTILFILWISLFGLFGNMYIHANAQGDGGIIRMKHAVWVDLANALLWLFSAVGMAVYWVRHRGGRSMWTGRATV
jgi:hypothetical protein